MSVSNLTVSQRYTCNGVTTTFAIPFAFISGDLTTIKVYTIDTTEGTRTLKTLTTHYTLSPSGNNPTNVVFNTAPASTLKVSIERVLPLTQAVDFISQRYTAGTHETALDKITLLLQQLNREVTRAPRMHLFDIDASFDTELPPLEAEGYLRVNAAGTGFEWVDSLLEPGSTFDDVSPMTAEGDIIIQGTSGAIRLAKGSAYQELAMDSTGTRPAWRTPPMTTRGDIIYHNGTIPARLAKGGVGAILKMNANDPEWLTRGSANQVLKVNNAGTDLEYAAPDTLLGFISNLSLNVSVAGNAMTITAKSADGTDLSSTNKGVVYFRSSTENVGTLTRVEITSNLTLTISAGSNLGIPSATDAWVYVFFINNAGTAELAACVNRLDDARRYSTTAEGGAGAADSATVLYSTTARSNVAVALFGKVLIAHSSNNWTTAPTVVALQMGAKKLGAWVVRSENTAYQALSDGLFVGYMSTSDGSGNEQTLLYGNTDSNSSPSTTRGSGYTWGHANAHIASGQGVSFCFPVKAGDYYLGNINNFVGAMTTSRAYYWIPLE